MFCVFDQNRRPGRPPRQCDASTCPMAASSGFEWSPGCAPSGDWPCVVPLHPHGNRNRHRFAWMFCRIDFIVGHNLKLKTMLWLIKTKTELDCCSYSFYKHIRIVWAFAIDDGCRFGHHFRRRVSDSSFVAAGELFFKNKMSCRIKLISLLFYRFILNLA